MTSFSSHKDLVIEMPFQPILWIQKLRLQAFQMDCMAQETGARFAEHAICMKPVLSQLWCPILMDPVA